MLAQLASAQQSLYTALLVGARMQAQVVSTPTCAALLVGVCTVAAVPADVWLSIPERALLASVLQILVRVLLARATTASPVRLFASQNQRD
jgi:hypothetical protein